MNTKQLAGILMGVGGLSFGLYFFLRGRGLKRFADNLSFHVDLNKGLPNCQHMDRYISVPVDVTLSNRSAETIKVRINSAKILDGKGNAVADVESDTGTRVLTVAPYKDTETRITFVYPTGIAYWSSKLAEVVQAVATGSLSTYARQFKSYFSQGFSVRLDVEVDGVPITHTLALSDSKNGTQGLGLVSTTSRRIGSKRDYLHLIPPASQLQRTDPLIFVGTTTETADFIREVAGKYRGDVSRLAKQLQQKTLRDTLENIYGFVYKYIRYQKDSAAREEVRIPLRTLHDQTGDCDCYATLIASMLEALGIPYRVRLAEYRSKGYFQHVYIIVPDRAAPRGYWVVDPVVEGFDTEEPYTRIKDR